MIMCLSSQQNKTKTFMWHMLINGFSLCVCLCVSVCACPVTSTRCHEIQFEVMKEAQSYVSLFCRIKASDTKWIGVKMDIICEN